MTIGQGSIIRNNKANNGAPFPANAAENGVSVDPVTGRIVLGDDGITNLAQLLSNRAISLNSFAIALNDALFTFLIDAQAGNPGLIFTGDFNTTGIDIGMQFTDANSANDIGLIVFRLSETGQLFGMINGATGSVSGMFARRGNVLLAPNGLEGALPAPLAAIDIIGDVSTSDPGSGQGLWKLGKFVAGAVALDNANYVEVEIDGVVRKLLVAL